MFQKQESKYIWDKTDYGKNLEEVVIFCVEYVLELRSKRFNGITYLLF